MLRVRVTPRARYGRFEGWRDGRLHVRTTAPPVGGRANDAVCRLIADTLGVAPRRVRIVRGAHGRDKTVQIDALSLRDVLRILAYPDVK